MSRAASAATGAIVRVPRLKRALAFRACMRSERAHLLRARLLSSTVTFVLFARAGAGASVSVIYADKMFTVFTRAAY